MTPIQKKFISLLKECISNCKCIKTAYFDSFDYTTTGSNFCHPRMLGLIAKAAWMLPKAGAVDIDVKLNAGGGIKFQPDIFVRDDSETPILAVDFESPNSSDARIPWKDVEPYLKWVEKSQSEVPYIIFTCLPKNARSWELRWTNVNGWNADHRDARDQIIGAPFTYWYEFYRKNAGPMLNQHGNLAGKVLFVNFDGLRLEPVELHTT